MCQEIINELESYAEPNFAKWVKPFLNISDVSEEVVLGVRVPILRKLAKKYKDINIDILKKILQSKVHEHRALAVFIMLYKSKSEPQLMCDLYLQNLDYINNWDLIDYTAPHIVAPYVNKVTLRNLAGEDYLWANRVAMVSTIYYIKQDDYTLTLEFAKRYIKHPHHLMHKAAGWMLREVGKRDEIILKKFLSENSQNMPAIMRTYATEKLKKK